MKILDIYKHPAQGIEAIKGGFSWPAFFFCFILMLVKKLLRFPGAWFFSYITTDAATAQITAST